MNNMVSCYHRITKRGVGMLKTDITFVRIFLKQIKKLITENKYIIVERDKTMETMALFGIDFDTVKEIILELTPKDYFNGPIEDRDIKNEYIWEFGKKIFDKEIYIKLKIIDEEDIGKCISFHIAEKEINYPFK